MQSKKTFFVEATAAAALAYIADFRTLTEWEPSVQKALQTKGEGPGVDAAYRITMRFAGRESEMTYQCETYAADHAILRGDGDGFSACDRIDVRTLDSGSEVTYCTDIRLQTRLGQTLTPVVALLFSLNVRRAAKQLQQRLRT